MSEGAISIKKAIPIIVIAWILSLVTTLAVAYFTPFIPIGASQIGDDAVTADKILDGAIITTKLDDGTVTSAKILDATITAEDLASGSIITVKVANEAITTAKIADDSVTEAKIADGAIVTVKLADDSVTTSKIEDDAIVTVKLADGSVTSAKIRDGTIVAADLATGAVTSIKITDGAVTTSKIADYAVTNLKLAAGAIPFNVTTSNVVHLITTLSWVNMSYMSVEITLERNSTLLIMFSTDAYNTDPDYRILVQAVVSGSVARPGWVYLTPQVYVGGVFPHQHRLGWAAYAYNFYADSVSAGTYTVYIQYRVDGGIGYAWRPTLSVAAFPT
jgi:molybdopterin-binding protein